MDGPGRLIYPNYQYHGDFKRNLPIGKGCFTFDLKCMQHGFYVNLRDPKFDYVGAEEMAIDGEKPEGKAKYLKHWMRQKMFA